MNCSRREDSQRRSIYLPRHDKRCSAPSKLDSQASFFSIDASKLRYLAVQISSSGYHAHNLVQRRFVLRTTQVPFPQSDGQVVASPTSWSGQQQSEICSSPARIIRWSLARSTTFQNDHWNMDISTSRSSSMRGRYQFCFRHESENRPLFGITQP